MIKSGKKTQTRRIWKRRMVKVGGIYKVKTEMLSKEHHCKIKVTAIREEKLLDIPRDDVLKEGYDTFYDFFKVWKDINGDIENVCVYVIDFEVVKE